MNIKKIDIDGKNFDSVMFFCACCYPLFKYSYREVGDIFQTILIIGSLFHIYKYKYFFIKDKMVTCLFVSIILTISAWLASTFYIPNLAKETPNLSILSKLFLFIIIAYWLKSNMRRIYIFLSCYCIGLLILFYGHSNNFISDTVSGAHGVRIDYNVVNANHPAVLSGIAFLLCGFYFIKNMYSIKSILTYKRLALLISLLILMFYFGFVVLATQSRQVWLAIPSALLLAPIIYIFTKKVNAKQAIKITSISFIFILIPLILATKLDYVEHRADKEQNVMHQIIEGNVNDLPYTSIGIRIHFWLEAQKWIKQNPLFGYGEEARGLVISQSKVLPENIKNNFSHLHNSYIELIVQYGVLSIVLFIYIYYQLIRSAYLEKSGEIFYLSLLFFIFWFITNNFESYTLQKTGEIITNIFSPIFYTFKITSDFIDYQKPT